MMAGAEQEMEVENCQAESSRGAHESERAGNPWPYLSRSSFSNANEGITLSGDANVPAPVDTAVAVKTSVFFFLLFFLLLHK